MRLELSRWIEADLEEIGDWIASGNPRRAVSFIQEMRQAIYNVGDKPFTYQLRPKIGEDARLAVFGRYVILFRVDGEVVRVERVVYGGRNLPKLPG